MLKIQLNHSFIQLTNHNSVISPKNQHNQQHIQQSNHKNRENNLHKNWAKRKQEWWTWKHYEHNFYNLAHKLDSIRHHVHFLSILLNIIILPPYPTHLQCLLMHEKNFLLKQTVTMTKIGLLSESLVYIKVKIDSKSCRAGNYSSIIYWNATNWLQSPFTRNYYEKNHHRYRQMYLTGSLKRDLFFRWYKGELSVINTHEKIFSLRINWGAYKNVCAWLSLF
jgi:hypothetical protein